MEGSNPGFVDREPSQHCYQVPTSHLYSLEIAAPTAGLLLRHGCIF